MDAKKISELMERLYRIHRQIGELNSRLEKGKKLIAFNRMKQEQEQKKINSMREKHLELHLDAKQKEQDLESREDSVRRRKSQMDAAKSNKEYLALKEQIQADEAVNSKLAGDALEAISAAEEFEVQVHQEEKELETLIQQGKELEKSFEEERAVLEKDVIRCTGLLHAAEEELPLLFADTYHRLVRSVGGEATLAPITNQCYCGNCNQQIPIRRIMEICEGKLYICQACGRILYAPENYVLR